MMVPWILKAEVLAHLAALDNPPTERQFDRWCREDFFPRPRHLFLGKKHGTSSEYAPETLAIATRVHHLLQEHRDFDFVRVRLWIEAVPQPLARLRASLERLALAPFEAFLQRGTDEISVNQHLVEFMQTSDRGGLRRCIREQVDSDRAMQDLMRMILEMGVGGTAFFQEPRRLLNGDDPAELLVRGMGFGNARHYGINDSPPWFGPNIAKDFAQMENGDVVSYEFQRRSIAEATMAKLDQAMHDVKTIVLVLQQFSILLDRLNLPPLFGWLFAQLDLKDTTIVARMVVIFLTLRNALGDSNANHLALVAEMQLPVFNEALANLDAHPEWHEALREHMLAMFHYYPANSQLGAEAS